MTGFLLSWGVVTGFPAPRILRLQRIKDGNERSWFGSKNYFSMARFCLISSLGQEPILPTFKGILSEHINEAPWNCGINHLHINLQMIIGAAEVTQISLTPYASFRLNGDSVVGNGEKLTAKEQYGYRSGRQGTTSTLPIFGRLHGCVPICLLGRMDPRWRLAGQHYWSINRFNTGQGVSARRAYPYLKID